MRLVKKIFKIFFRKEIKNELIKIEKGVRLSSHTKVGNYTFIGACTNVGDNCKEIGSYCSIGQNSLIGPNIHPLERMSTSAVFYSQSWGVVDYNEKKEFNTQPVKIANDVWIGAYAIILPGVSIGNGAIIGANSVVTKDVPDYAIVAGVPAKILKYRFEHSVIHRLLIGKWWEKKPEEVLGDYKKFRP